MCASVVSMVSIHPHSRLGQWYPRVPVCADAVCLLFTGILSLPQTVFGCHTISSDYQTRTVWTHSTWTYHWGLERSWHFDTTLSSPFKQDYKDTSHTLWCTFGNTLGWWDDRKRNGKPVLPLYLRLDIPSNLSRALSCLCLSGHNFLVQRMRHDRNRRPYELRICDSCDWHTSQDEEHILLDGPHEHLVRLCTQQQLIFPPQFEDGPARLRIFLNLMFLELPLL